MGSLRNSAPSSCRYAPRAGAKDLKARPRAAIAGAALALLALAGCGGVAKAPAPEAATTRAEATTPAPVPAAPDIAAQPDETTGLAAEAPPPPAERYTALPPAPKVALTQLPGMSSGQILTLLGEPQLLRAETSAEIWQYRGAACVLHLFLYRKGGALEVRHAEARPRAIAGNGAAGEGGPATVAPTSGAAADECLGQLAAARPTS